MLLIPEKKAVLLRPKSPQRLLKIIPTAKIIQYRGRETVAVPHRIDEMRVLNNLGLDAPSPILREYTWPHGPQIEKPFQAQLTTAAMLTLNRRAFVLNDMGTGKSLATLWAFDYLKRKGLANKLLVVCPLSTMDRAWGDEMFFHLPHLTYSVLYGEKKRRLKMLSKDVDVYIVNHHGAQVIADELFARTDITHVALDEIAKVARNKETDLWKAMNVVINGPKNNRKRVAWGLSATPIPNSPTDAWAQCRLLVPDTVPRYFGRFRDLVMRQSGPYTWVPRKNAIDVVDKVMTPAVRFRLEDCIDLPQTIYMTRHAEMTKTQAVAYDSMFRTLAAQLEDGGILAVNEAVKVSKLVQIACGVVYDVRGNELVVDASSRMKVVLEAIEESDSKTIVFCPYVSTIAPIVDLLRGCGIEAAAIHGGVKKSERDSIFLAFQKTPRVSVIVAQPDAMSHGLTLTAGSTIVWYAPTTKAETYEQANGRIVRPGQKYTTRIIHIEGTTVERRIYARLKAKQAMQGLLLERKVHREVA